MPGFVQDLRFAARALARRPGFTAAVAVTLALAIGASTAVFSLVDSVLLRRLPFPEEERLVAVWSTVRRDIVERRALSYPDFVDLAAGAGSLESAAAVVDSSWIVGGGDRAERLTAELVTSDYFRVLGIAPAIGRELSAGAPEVPEALIGHGLWRRRFGGDPAALGARLRLDDTEHTVVGVMPPGFSGLNDGTELWTSLPAVLPPEVKEDRGGRFLDAVARLAPGAGRERAAAELAALAAGLEREYPDDNTGYGFDLGPLRAELVGALETPLAVLSAAVLCVLLIACANVANLMLVRAAARGRESAVHAALGAGRGRLLRRALAEAMLLGLAGGAAGVALAAWGLEALLAVSPIAVPELLPVGLDLRVLGFSLALTLATALALGTATAVRGRARLAETLLPGARAAGGSPAARRTRGLLVAAEVAVALLLLVSAGLLTRSFLRLRGVDPGFAGEGLVFFRIDLAATGWGDEERQAFGPRLVEALGAVPGVERAVASSDTPLQQGWAATVVSPEGRAHDPAAPYGGGTRVYRHLVSPGFFATLGIPIVRGRALEDGDAGAAAAPVVVSAEMARRTWGEDDPVGRRLKLGPPASEQPWMTVVGVAADARYRNLVRDPLDTPDDPDVYFPLDAAPQSGLAVTVRAAAAPEALAPALRDAVARLDPALAVYEVETPAVRLGRHRAGPRFTALLLGLFSALALALAAVGVYGVLSYAVAERTREIGVRMALGARAQRVLALVLGQGMAPVALGAAAGLALAAASTRLFESLLFEVAATEPAVFAGVTAVLLAVALAACLLPARRASRVDPVVALRHE